MKKYTAAVATALMAAVLGSTAFAVNTAPALKDIDNYWGKTAIQYFYDKHYVSGFNGEFRPNDEVTREGVAAILNNVIGDSQAAGQHLFTDVRGRWSEHAVNAMVDKQIMRGYSDNTFRPEQKITREEFAVLAYNYMNYKGLGAQESAVPYKDEAQISSWAKKAVDTLAAAGYMKGTDNLFQPKAYVTRGEAVNVLYRILTGGQQTVTDQRAVETLVFADVTKAYGSVKRFSQDGIMYWQGNKLYLGAKTKADRDKLAEIIRTDTALPVDTVYVRQSTYSYTEYKNLMAEAEKVYKQSEGADGFVKTDVDYLNEMVVLTVHSVSPETQQHLNEALGNALRIIIQ